MENEEKVLGKIVSQFENSIIRIILFTVSELPFSLGIKKLIRVLKGSKSTFNIDHNLIDLPTFSLLKSFSTKELEDIIEVLLKYELLKIEYVSRYENMPVIELNEIGKKVLNSDEETTLSIIDILVDKEVIQFDEREIILFDDLRKIRRKIARSIDIAPFMVCGDQVLRQIVKEKPKTREELLGIRGIGEKSIERFEKEFLEEINRS